MDFILHYLSSITKIMYMQNIQQGKHNKRQLFQKVPKYILQF